MSKLDTYRRADGPLPDAYAAWQLHGAGFENVGHNGQPDRLPLREPKDNEILLRVDALGICQSDIKIINQGSKHARLRGRDLGQEPTVLGHECAATVVRVGDRWKGQFEPGQRFIIQADIYYKGLGYAFGYLIPGGLAEYFYLDERALEGDEGCYLLPVQPGTGYSESALSEPWACVEMSYNLDERRLPGNGAILIIDDHPGDWATAYPTATIVPRSLEGLPGGPFDDIILPLPNPELVNRLAPLLAKKGVMFLLGAPEADGPVSLDIGRIHYEDIRFYGGGDDLPALDELHARADLLPGGAALFLGAGGPMGQMHVQRAVEIPNGPKTVVVTDLDRGRLDHIVERFGPMAEKKGVALITLSPEECGGQAGMDAKIAEAAPHGYSDIIVMAPVARLAADTLKFAADNALVNVFAGVGIGTCADVALRDLCRGIKLFGSSGSRIRDLRKVLEMVERRELNTNMSIAAIGGLRAAKEGLVGQSEARYPGKTVIYTQIPDLPLMAIEEIPEKIPALKDKLGPNYTWTQAAEEALLEMYV